MTSAISDAFVFIDDISDGQENVKISFINTKNVQTLLKSVFYTPNNILMTDTLTEEFESVPLPCKCEDVCGNGCSCLLDSKIPYFNGILSEEFVRDESRPIIECSVLCACGNHCSNRVVQNGIKIPLQVFMTDQKGFGVQTLEFIPKLSFVCEYAGEILDKTEVLGRMKYRSLEEPNYVYVLKEFSSKSNLCTIIDPTIYGNVGRYLNHSCSPNLAPVPVRANSMVPRLSFFAKRNIMPYEELTYDYGIGLAQKDREIASVSGCNSFKMGQKKCYCGSIECEGILPFDFQWLN